MESVMNSNPEDWTSRESYERMVARQGGSQLRKTQRSATKAEKHLEEALNPDQQQLFHAAADATVDANSLRETVASRIALAHGIGIGAALARHASPDDNAAEVAALAASLVTDLLATGVARRKALDVAQTVIEVLRFADGALASMTADNGAEEGPREEGVEE